MSSSHAVLLQLAETLKKSAQQLSAQESKFIADLAEAKRERDEYKHDRDDLRRQIEQLRKRCDTDIDDLRTQRDSAAKLSNEFKLEKESWKQDAKFSKASLDQLMLSHQRLETQYEQLKQDNATLQNDRDYWKKQCLKADQDAKNWQTCYVQQDRERETLSTKLAELVEDQIALHRKSIQVTQRSHALESLSAPIVPSKTNTIDKQSASLKTLDDIIPPRPPKRQSVAARPIRPRSAAGPSEPPPPYLNSHHHHRTKRQRLSEHTPPFEPASSVLIRRVHDAVVPRTIKDEEDSDQGGLLTSPTKPLAKSRQRNSRKRSQILSEEEVAALDEQDDASGHVASTRRKQTVSHYQEEDEEDDSDDELHLAPSTSRIPPSSKLKGSRAQVNRPNRSKRK